MRSGASGGPKDPTWAAWVLLGHLLHGVKAGYLQAAPAWWVESVQVVLDEIEPCWAGGSGSEDKGR